MTPRTCAADGCGTILSQYRPNDEKCAAHAHEKSSYESLFPGWTRQAACRGMDTERFDVDLPTSGEMTQPVLAAKRVCAGCPVWDDCLAFAFSNEFYADVVFGGLTGRERSAIAGRHDRVQRASALRLQQEITYRLVPVRGRKGAVA